MVKQLRWGIAGSGKICSDFVASLMIAKDEHLVEAVAARTQDSANEFAKKYGIMKSYEGYHLLASDPNIDIVYIGTINTQHYAIAKHILKKGKHVLCEKPMTMNKKDTEELIELAKKENLLLLDGIWSRSFPAYEQLGKLINSKSIGEIKQVVISFGFNLQQVDRVTKKKLGGSAVLDLGVYTLQLVQFIFRGLKPLKVIADGNVNLENIDTTMNAIMSYPHGKKAIIACSSEVELGNEAIIYGTKGIIKIPQFWCPTKLILCDTTMQFDLPENKFQFYFQNSNGLLYQAQHARDLINHGKIASGNITPIESLELSELMDNIREQIGAV